MADTQDTNEPQGSPFSRPAFVVAGVLVLAIVLLGIIVAVRVAGSNNATAQPPPPSTTSTEATPTAAPSTPTEQAASVCGLPAGMDSGPLTSPPAVTWAYQGTIAYPKSPELGAGQTASEGYRYCFQRSPAGALVMTANAMAQGSDPTVGNAWAEYALGDGQYHDQLAQEIAKPVKGSGGTRLRVAGFRVLSFDGTSARIDLGLQGSSQNQNLTLSAVYELVWQEGDWKLSAAVEQPLDISTIPDFSGYVPWGE